MKITGNYTIDAPREQVWAALNDMEVLARIVPGCERLEQTGENEYEGTVKVGIQTIKGSYNGRIRIEDIQPPHHYRLVASGRSANGVVDGAGNIDLAEEDGKTILTYNGDAQIGGVLASVGQRLIEGASKQLINQSIKALVEQIAARSNGAADEAVEVGASVVAAEPAPSTAAPAAPEAAPSEPPAPNPAQDAQPSQLSTPSFERRTVLVPEQEQLTPESMVRGVIEDLLRERPWLPWVALAFLLGLLIGRSGRKA